MTTKIKGQEMHLWVGNDTSAESIALATNTTLEITGNTSSVSVKTKGDVGGEPQWDESEIDSLSWTASSDSVFAVTTSDGKSYEDLYDAMISGQPISIAFGRKASGSLSESGTHGWKKGTDFKFEGKCLITSLSMTASVSDYTTFSASFQGVGALRKV